MKENSARALLAIVLIACGCMALIDGVIQPGYVVKSVIKLALFLALPLLYARYDRGCDLKALFRPQRDSLLLAFGIGVGVYGVILGAYFLLRGVIDFSALTASLTASTGVRKENFLFVSLYISFVNSLLEEFFFRGFAFLTLRRKVGRGFAYAFSAGMFSLYHVAMMIGWFSLPVLFLALAGLFVGGALFNFFNERHGTIYLSWLIHMFANFAINTVGFILFAA